MTIKKFRVSYLDKYGRYCVTNMFSCDLSSAFNIFSNLNSTLKILSVEEID